jgi:hypothetical protein
MFLAILVIALLLVPCRNRASIDVQVTPGPFEVYTYAYVRRPWKTDHG